MKIADVLSMHGVTKYTKGIKSLFGFRVDYTNSDPEKAVTYIEDAEDESPAKALEVADGTSKWLTYYPFNAIRPVVLQNGAVIDEVDKNDFTKTISGTSIPNSEDIMIEIPKVYWKFTKTSNGYEVRWSKTKYDDDFKALAHMKGGVEKDFIYVGAYEGYLLDNKLSSTSGRTVTTKVDITSFINYATAKGEGYGIMNFYTTLLLQILFVTMFKTLNSQSIAYGGSVGATGEFDKSGMNVLNNSSGSRMKFLGIENLWGSRGTFISGLFVKNASTILLNDGSVAESAWDSYPIKVSGALIGSTYTPKNVLATTENGFIMTTSGGSSTTYYCDTQQYTTNYPCCVFGGAGSATNYGIFYYQAYWGKTETSSSLSTRLCYS